MWYRREKITICKKSMFTADFIFFLLINFNSILVLYLKFEIGFGTYYLILYTSLFEIDFGTY